MHTQSLRFIVLSGAHKDKRYLNMMPSLHYSPNRMFPALLSVLVLIAAAAAAAESLATQSSTFVCPSMNVTHICSCSNGNVTCDNLGATDLTFVEPSASAITNLSASHNELHELSANFLVGASNLTKLTLHYNKIRSIDVRCFDSLISLETLDLSYNELEKFYLPRKSLTKLRILRLTYNSLVHLTLEDDRPIAIDQLFLTNNRIGNNLEFVKNVTNARLLALGSNSITNLSFSVFLKNNHLQCLRLSNNSLSDLDFLNTTEILWELNISKNKIKKVPEEAFLKLSLLTTLGLAENEIEDTSFLKYITSNIKRLDLSGNNISKIDSTYLANKTKLWYIDVSLNKLKDLYFTVKAKYLETLLANDNEISGTDDTILSRDYLWGKQINKLDLSNNRISNIQFTSHLTNVSAINLSNNTLDNIPENTLFQLTKLKILDLSCNKIKNVNFVLHAKLLSVLNLSHNSVEDIPCNDNLEQLFLNGNNINEINLNCVPRLRDFTIYDGIFRDRRDQVLLKSREVELKINRETVMFPCFPSHDTIIKCKITCSSEDAKRTTCHPPYNTASIGLPLAITILCICITVSFLIMFCVIMKCCEWYRRKVKNKNICLCRVDIHTHQPLPTNDVDSREN